MRRHLALLALTLLLPGCALFSPRVDGARVNFRVSVLGGNLHEIAFFVPVQGRLTQVQVFRPKPDGGREIVWSSHGAAPVASLTAHGCRDCVGYGLDYEGLVQDSAGRPLENVEIYVVHVTVLDEKGRELRGAAVFIASEREGVEYGCDSVSECVAYLQSTVT